MHFPWHRRDAGLMAAGVPRHPQWRKESGLWLRGKVCAASGSTRNVRAHHLIPFHVRPDLEMDCDNWLALSDDGWGGINYHILIGHGGDFTDYNPHAVGDAARCLIMIRGRIAA